MARLKYSTRARDDLDRLVEFLEQAAPGSVPDVLDGILRALEALADHPHLGRRVGETPLRELVISRGATGYLALYEVDAARELVYVHRIRHQRETGYLD